MGYQVAYLKTWQVPYGKQSPYPPQYYSNPPSPGSPAPFETSYIEPVSFYVCLINLPPGYFYFQFKVGTRYWVEGNWVRLTTSVNGELGLYYALFQCYLSAQSNWEYLYTFDISEFPNCAIRTRPWSEISNPAIAPFPGGAAQEHYWGGEHDPWTIHAGFRFRYPYVLTPPILPITSARRLEGSIYRQPLST